jgi:predicted GNAT family acetyltransferase
MSDYTTTHKPDNFKIVIVDEDREIGRLTYNLEKGIMQITGTYVDPTFRGKSFAKKMVQSAIEIAKEEKWFIQPICPYVVSFFKRNQEYNHMLVPEK